MPLTKITPERLAVARALESDCWTHERIAGFLNVTRSAVSYALQKRKTGLPSNQEVASAKLASYIFERTQLVARRAVAVELRTIAAELEG